MNGRDANEKREREKKRSSTSEGSVPRDLQLQVSPATSCSMFSLKKKRTRVYSLFDYITYRFLQTLLEGRWVRSANAGMAVSTWISLIFELAGFARS